MRACISKWTLFIFEREAVRITPLNLRHKRVVAVPLNKLFLLLVKWHRFWLTSQGNSAIVLRLGAEGCFPSCLLWPWASVDSGSSRALLSGHWIACVSSFPFPKVLSWLCVELLFDPSNMFPAHWRDTLILKQCLFKKKILVADTWWALDGVGGGKAFRSMLVPRVPLTFCTTDSANTMIFIKEKT